VRLLPATMPIFSHFHPRQDRWPAHFQTLTSSPDNLPLIQGPALNLAPFERLLEASPNLICRRPADGLFCLEGETWFGGGPWWRRELLPKSTNLPFSTKRIPLYP
jgi:hypothetical protein